MRAWVAARGNEGSSAGGRSHAVPPRRGPPTAVKVLLPVWGERYVAQFLEVSLPSLLAPGNVPALADALPCQFVLMTSRADAEAIREHPVWRRLGDVCDAEILLIDDM